MKQIPRNLPEDLKDFVYRVQALSRVQPQGIFLLTGCPRSGTSAMRDWLQAQPGISAMFEPRILIGAHRFVNETNRFSALHGDREILLMLIRQLVLAYCARTKFVWHQRLVIKEPLEEIAFPDHDYESFLKNARAIFPELKVIFMVREPIPTIWSMRQREWGHSLTQISLRSYTLLECIQNWRACAELACQNAADSQVYLCKFEKLVTEPAEESLRIFDFLGIRGQSAFQPKSTKTSAFTEVEEALIMAETEPLRNRLADVN